MYATPAAQAEKPALRPSSPSSPPWRSAAAPLSTAPVGFAEREAQRRNARIAQLDALFAVRDRFRGRNRYYYQTLTDLVRFAIPKGLRVLEIGCGSGDLLAALEPSEGVGVDLSPRHLESARARHPHLTFLDGDAETLDAPELLARAPFDAVVLADTIGYVSDVWAMLRALRGVCAPHTRVFLSYYNFAWAPLLRWATARGLRQPVPDENWLGRADIHNLLEVNHFEVVKSGVALLLPVEVPLLSTLANRYLAHLPGLRHLALTQYFVARLAESGAPPREHPYRCTVVVPCRNERGNIDEIVARTPVMGQGTELLFVDGQSGDGTVAAIERHLASPPPVEGLTLRLLHQGGGKGKGDAVRKGFAAASGELLFILDADLTVPPEDLPKFYAAVAEGKGEFINGSRLVYPMEGEAMRFLNLLGNRFFGWALSAILGQRLKDTLCGTKVLRRSDYQRVQATRAFLGDFDPFGDFDLIFGAAKANLKIVELPIRYRARTYGETKISRFRHGWLLLRMTTHAFRKFRLG